MGGLGHKNVCMCVCASGNEQKFERGWSIYGATKRAIKNKEAIKICAEGVKIGGGL